MSNLTFTQQFDDSSFFQIPADFAKGSASSVIIKTDRVETVLGPPHVTEGDKLVESAPGIAIVSPSRLNLKILIREPQRNRYI